MAQEALLADLTAGARCVLDEPHLDHLTSATFLVSGVVARGAPIKLSAVLRPEVVLRLLEPLPRRDSARFSSLVLEIGPTHTAVKGVLCQKPEPFALAEAKHLLGMDFGYVNTCAAAVVAVDKALDPEWLAGVQDWGKEQAREYLETHAHDGEAVEGVLHRGRNFLAAVERHAGHVDRLRSEIDRIYNRLGRLKHEINRLLGKPSDARVDLAPAPARMPERPRGNERVLDLLSRFTKLLEVVARLKLLRRGVYRAVDGLKRSWFGWLSTRLCRMCRRHQAAYVRERLTVVAAEKGGPEYKGRTFNKMLNNGSKGQFLRGMSSKLK